MVTSGAEGCRRVRPCLRIVELLLPLTECMPRNARKKSRLLRRSCCSYNQEALAESVGETLLGLLGRPPATTVSTAPAMPGHDPEPLEQVGVEGECAVGLA